jgi:hypothetical protein
MPTNRVAEFGVGLLSEKQPTVRVAEVGSGVVYRQVVHARVAEFGVGILRSYATSVMPSSGQTTNVYVIVG